MRYEKIAFSKNLETHPYLLTKKIIEDCRLLFSSLMDISFIESKETSINVFKNIKLEYKHKELWQEIWDRHSEKEYKEFIELKAHRLDINNLVPLIKNKTCVDFGCGNGAFCFALLEKGAKSVIGIDFGSKSIEYAKKISQTLGYNKKVKFINSQVYDTPFDNEQFDFAVSNGVFHHLSLSNMEKAVAEVARVLKNNGWFWYYIDGIGAISMDLWDKSVEILEDIPLLMIERVLKELNISRNKMVHLMDGLNATYIHSNYQETINMLSKYEFTDFKRLTGGTNTDFDFDKINTDPYGNEKFGEGDLRILAQKKKL